MTQYEKYIKENTPSIEKVAELLESDNSTCCCNCIYSGEFCGAGNKHSCLDGIIKFLKSEVTDNV